MIPQADLRPDVATAMLPRPFRVTGRVQETADTTTLTLEAVDGTPLRFAAGQFTMIAAYGHNEVPISISGDPTSGGPLVHTIRDVGAATHALTRSLPGETLWVRGPFGTGWNVADAAGGDLVVVAGGIGLAPLRPVILEAIAHRERYGRLVLLYGTRTPEDILFGREFADWARAGVQVDLVVDAAPPPWPGRVGLVTSLIPRAGFDPSRTLALVCGPEVMMRYVARALADRGVPDDRIRVSLERNMQCGVGLCGHCQLRGFFVCTDGPVFDYDRVARLMMIREL